MDIMIKCEYRKIIGSIYIGPHGDIVVTGVPEKTENEEIGHNCDEMGCGQEHVLLRGIVTKGVKWCDSIHENPEIWEEAK